MNSDTELVIREWMDEFGDDTSWIYAQAINSWKAGDRAFRGCSSSQEVQAIVAAVLRGESFLPSN